MTCGSPLTGIALKTAAIANAPSSAGRQHFAAHLSPDVKVSDHATRTVAVTTSLYVDGLMARAHLSSFPLPRCVVRDTGLYKLMGRDVQRGLAGSITTARWKHSGSFRFRNSGTATLNSRPLAE
jgi:hypothetical protein